MKNKLFLFVLLFSLTLSAQNVSRVLLRGIVVSDSLEVENIIIKNTTANRITVTDKNGNFSLFVKEKDTLVFSAVSFNSSVLIVNKSHLEDALVTVRLSVKINELDEVIVRPYTLTGNLETDSKNLKVKMADLNLTNVDLSDASPKYNKVDNSLAQITPGTGNSFNGVDFIALGKMAGKALSKGNSKQEKIEYISDKIFPEAVKEKFDPQFFTETLKLKPEEIDLFLAFCDDATPERRNLLKPKNEFQLIDFLLNKSEEFHKKMR